MTRREQIAIPALLLLLCVSGVDVHDAFSVLNNSDDQWQPPAQDEASLLSPAVCNPNPCPDLSLIWLLIFSPNLSNSDFTRVKNLIKKSTETCMLRQRNTKVIFLGPNGPVHSTAWSNQETEGLVQVDDFSVTKKLTVHEFADILQEAIKNLTTNWSEKHLYVITDLDLALTERDARHVLESLHKTECTLRYMQLPSPTGKSSSVETLIKNNLGIITDTILVSLKTIEDIGLFNSEFLPCEDVPDPEDVSFPVGPFRDPGSFGPGPGPFGPRPRFFRPGPFGLGPGPFVPGPGGPFPGPGPMEPDLVIGISRFHQGNRPFNGESGSPGDTGDAFGPVDNRFNPSLAAAGAGSSTSSNPSTASSNLLIVLVSILVLLLILMSAVIAYFVIRRKREKEQVEISLNLQKQVEKGVENHYA